MERFHRGLPQAVNPFHLGISDGWILQSPMLTLNPMPFLCDLWQLLPLIFKQASEHIAKPFPRTHQVPSLLQSVLRRGWPRSTGHLSPHIRATKSWPALPASGTRFCEHPDAGRPHHPLHSRSARHAAPPSACPKRHCSSARVGHLPPDARTRKGPTPPA